MNLALNIVWLILGGGFITALSWGLGGIILCMTVIGIPFGLGAFRVAAYAAMPFGKELVSAEFLGEKRIPGSFIVSLIWIVFAGIWLAIEHLILSGLCAVTIIGIIFAIAHFKIMKIAFNPFGMRVVSSEVAEEIRKRHVDKVVDQVMDKKEKLQQPV